MIAICHVIPVFALFTSLLLHYVINSLWHMQDTPNFI